MVVLKCAGNQSQEPVNRRRHCAALSPRMSALCAIIVTPHLPESDASIHDSLASFSKTKTWDCPPGTHTKRTPHYLRWDACGLRFERPITQDKDRLDATPLGLSRTLRKSGS